MKIRLNLKRTKRNMIHSRMHDLTKTLHLKRKRPSNIG